MASQGNHNASAIPFIRGCWRFFKGYVLKRGFLDGSIGMRIALSNARETILKHKLLESEVRKSLTQR
jgi:hypothetical protein